MSIARREDDCFTSLKERGIWGIHSYLYYYEDLLFFWPESKKTKGHLKPALFPTAFSSVDTKLANLLL